MEQNTTNENKPTNLKVPVIAHFLCGWPLIMVAFGGAIGGGLGGAAYGINMIIYKSKMPIAAKVILNIFIGIASILLWYVIAQAISRRMSHE